jgi:hypothetical protein
VLKKRSDAENLQFYQDMLAPTSLTDKEVLETFQNMNDVIRMRMITTEVLPSPMQTYRIGKYEDVRIYK